MNKITCFLSELLPANYNVLNTPRSTVRGKRVATLFNDINKCSLLSVEKYTSFEVQLVNLELTYNVHCALIYRLPKYDKGLYSGFLSLIVPTTDNVLIIVDFV